MKSLFCMCHRTVNVVADVWNRIPQLKVFETFWDVVPEIILQSKGTLSSKIVFVLFTRKWILLRDYVLFFIFTIYFSVKPCFKLINMLSCEDFSNIWHKIYDISNICHNEANIRWSPPILMTPVMVIIA